MALKFIGICLYLFLVFLTPYFLASLPLFYDCWFLEASSYSFMIIFTVLLTAPLLISCEFLLGIGFLYFPTFSHIRTQTLGSLDQDCPDLRIKIVPATSTHFFLFGGAQKSGGTGGPSPTSSSLTPFPTTSISSPPSSFSSTSSLTSCSARPQPGLLGLYFSFFIIYF